MWVPAVLLDFSEYLVTLYHLSAARLVVLQPDELTIPELLKPVGYVLGHYVGVYVDLHLQEK